MVFHTDWAPQGDFLRMFTSALIRHSTIVCVGLLFAFATFSSFFDYSQMKVLLILPN